MAVAFGPDSSAYQTTLLSPRLRPRPPTLANRQFTELRPVRLTIRKSSEVASSGPTPPSQLTLKWFHGLSSQGPTPLEATFHR